MSFLKLSISKTLRKKEHFRGDLGIWKLISYNPMHKC